MGACDTCKVEINILVYENETFSLPAEFHFKQVRIFSEILLLNPKKQKRI